MDHLPVLLFTHNAPVNLLEERSDESQVQPDVRFKDSYNTISDTNPSYQKMLLQRNRNISKVVLHYKPK